MEKRYSLYGFIIFESVKGLGWIQHVGDWYDRGEMIYIAGNAFIFKEYDVLLLGRSRVMKVDKKMKTFEDVERYLDSLPKWDKTKYYVKLADIELDSLIECKTGKVVYSEKNPEILKSLRLIEEERRPEDF
ncbi:MAG: hypothetical protein AMS17_17640 [Spirochaetes bacterium DG_61]|nr:MAG: hypothetical protein AMS17_17640 [Spirochaetes bacterium DG_61]